MLASLFAAAVVGVSQPCMASREFAVQAPAGHTIAAVLETGRPTVRQPTVILISGSGPHTRDYSTASSDDKANHAFVALARQLVLAGFAVVRFDEHGTGQSTGNYARTATTASLADDVQGWSSRWLVVPKATRIASSRLATVEGA